MSAAGVQRTILIADDTAMFRDLGSLFLARTGRVVTAHDGLEALERVRRECPSVVVADLDMPRMGGDELCRHLKADPETRDLPVILVTGTSEADERARAVRAGPDDVIAKPISRIALIQAVNRFLREQPVRGLARVPFEAEVQIEHHGTERRATARNVSRGGIYVESDPLMALATEVQLCFELPDDEDPVSPTAHVVWRREGDAGRAGGMGLQFLALDRASAERIDTFVYENAPPVRTRGGLTAAGRGSS